MIVRSSSRTAAGCGNRGARPASNRHCCDTGSAGSARSISTRRCARLICRAFRAKKIVFDLQLADLPVQKIDLRLAGRPLGHAAASKTLAAPRSSSCFFQL